MFLIVALLLTLTWVMAGSMQISYTSDADVQQTVYKKACDGIVERYFDGKDKARFTANTYLEMVRELRACGERVDTPVAK